MEEQGHHQCLKVEVEKDTGICTATLNRPEVLNAVNAQMNAELEEFFLRVNDNADVKAIILTGAGKAFCSGGDAKEMAGRSLSPARTVWTARRQIDLQLQVRQPIIAAVNGDAVGHGASLAIFCDVVIASEKARIGDPHVKMGLVAGDGGTVLWPLLVGALRAKEYLMTGDLLSAQEAERIGLINRVVAHDELYPVARSLAKRLASGPSLAVQWNKLMVNKLLRQQVDFVEDASIALEQLTVYSRDHEEAAKAFVEKRAPRFQGM